MKEVNLRENNYSFGNVTRDMEKIRFYVGRINSWVDLGLHAERLGEGTDQYIGHVEGSLALLYDSIDKMKERTLS